MTGRPHVPADDLAFVTGKFPGLVRAADGVSFGVSTGPNTISVPGQPARTSWIRSAPLSATTVALAGDAGAIGRHGLAALAELGGGRRRLRATASSGAPRA
jgi:hypothetical protein